MAEINLIKVCRRVNQSKKVCRAQSFGYDVLGHGHSQSIYVKIGFGNYLKATEVNFIKLLIKL